MIYRKFGKTGIDVSVIGFGGMRFEDENDSQTCAELVKYAYDSGINYFDTAPGYGKSEDLFGAAFKDMLKTRNEKPFYVSTKSMKTDPGIVRKELETSLTRMGLEYVDFFHLWYIVSVDEYRQRKANKVLKEFEKLKDEGLIKNICVSTHVDGADMGELLGDYPFTSVLMGYSIMNFSYRQAGIKAASDLGMAVVVMNPLGGGIIPNNPDRFDFVKTAPKETVVEAALRFLINDERINVSLVGFANKKQIDDAISAVNGFKKIPQERIDKIKESLRGYFNQLCTLCRYCDHCPAGIPIPFAMESYNQYALTKNPQRMLDQLEGHWAVKWDDFMAKECTKCGLCEKACTQKLDIINRLDFIRSEYKKRLEKQSQKD